MQVMSTFAQMADLCASNPRKRALHVAAEARGPLLDTFTSRLQRRAAVGASESAWAAVRTSVRGRALTSDILPTEELAAGFLAQCGMQPTLAQVAKARTAVLRNVLARCADSAQCALERGC
jgi:hypothetical protein